MSYQCVTIISLSRMQSSTMALYVSKLLKNQNRLNRLLQKLYKVLHPQKHQSFQPHQQQQVLTSALTPTYHFPEIEIQFLISQILPHTHTDTKILLFATYFSECPTNTTLPTLAATKPQQNLANKGNKVLENKGFNNMEGFLRHLTNNQFQSYSAALAITIGVGCFLLLLNILIFAAIYYQRVKRTLDAKRKEEFVETDMQMPHFIEQCMDKANGKNLINMSELSAKGQMDYTEYNRYSGQLEKSNLFANVCNVEHKCKSVGNDAHIEFMRPVSYPMNMGDTPEKSRRNSRNSQLLFHPTQYASTHVPSAMSGMSDAGSSNSSDLVTYQYHQQNCREYREQQKIKAEQCNQSTQADDFGAAIIESDADERPNNKIDENCHQHQNEKVSSTPSSLRSSISTTNYQGGILRQQPPTTPSATKKRVQIREISV